MPIRLNSFGGGSVTIDPVTTSSNFTLNLPAQSGTLLFSYANGSVGIGTSTPAATLDVSGNIFPTTDNSSDLGSTARRWRNIYTADLVLSNEGSQNDVDGTWGNWIIQEGENDLFLINKRNNKKYKFKLEEVPS